jgi:hypothetical protein
VGSIQAGDFDDNECEGWRGYEIEAIMDASHVGIYAAPNVVLLHAGTNDLKNLHSSGASDRLRTLIDLIYKINDKVAIFVCQIIPGDPSKYPTLVDATPAFNDDVAQIVTDYTGEGKAMVLVDQHSQLQVSDLADGLHPTVEGYTKMAEKFYTELTNNNNLISEPGTPQDPGPTSTNPDNCRATPSWYHVLEPIADGASV